MRSFVELFPRLLTPIMKDPNELRRRALPTEIRFGAFFSWTASGTPGFYDHWKKPAEFAGTLLANLDFITD